MENIRSNSKDKINIKVKYNTWFISIKRIYIENLSIDEILSNNIKIKIDVGKNQEVLYLTPYISQYLEYKKSIIDINDFKIKSENFSDDIKNIYISIESENNLNFNYQIYIGMPHVLEII
jgi:hypothetical protein